MTNNPTLAIAQISGQHSQRGYSFYSCITLLYKVDKQMFSTGKNQVKSMIMDNFLDIVKSQYVIYFFHGHLSSICFYQSFQSGVKMNKEYGFLISCFQGAPLRPLFLSSSPSIVNLVFSIDSSLLVFLVLFCSFHFFFRG